ncbi:hypothetical protein FRC12_015379 [Ceratobasidium sp. 428]|nr:hypothetical protein FRC12_015379 [Ceratobasidium sp. 428]
MSTSLSNEAQICITDAVAFTQLSLRGIFRHPASAARRSFFATCHDNAQSTGHQPATTSSHPAVSAHVPARQVPPPVRSAATHAMMGGYQPRFSGPSNTGSVPARVSNSRQDSINRHRTSRGTSAPGAHMGIRNPRPTAGSTTITTAPAPAAPKMFEAYVVVFPLATQSTDFKDVPMEEVINLEEDQLTYPAERIESCLRRFQTLDLLVPVSIPFNLTGEEFFAAFLDILQSFLSSHSWSLPRPGCGGTQFETKPFRMIVRTKRKGQLYLMPPRTLVLREFTAATLSKAPYNATPNTVDDDKKKVILFIAPVGDNMRGSIDRFPSVQDSSYHMHWCAGHRVFEGWPQNQFELQTNSSVDCFDNCTRRERVIELSSDDELPPVQQLITPNTRREVTTSGRTQRPRSTSLSHELPSDNHSDPDLEAAIEASLQPYQPAPAPDQGTHAEIRAEVPIPRTARRTPGYISNTMAVQAFFISLRNKYPQPIDEDDRFEFELESGTEQEGARHFIGFLRNFVGDMLGIAGSSSFGDVWTSSIKVRPKSIAGLLLLDRHIWRLGQGMGKAVREGILREAMDIIFSVPQHYQENPHTGNCVPLRPVVLGSSEANSDRQLQFAMAGLFSALYMIWTRSGPSKLSGIFLQVIIDDWDSLLGERLLETLCPSFYDMYLPLVHMPLDVPFDHRDPLYFLVEPALEGQDIRTMEGQTQESRARSPLFHRALCNATIGHHLLSASRPESIFHNEDVKSFRRGFDLKLRNNETFMQALRPQTTDIFPAMWCRMLPSSQVLLEHLHICAEPDHLGNSPPLSPDEMAIKRAIERMIVLPGHPMCPALRHLISSEDYERYCEDEVVRARWLLMAATNSPLTPTDPNWRITIELVKDREPRPDPNGPRPILWHICYATGTLTYDKALINAAVETLVEDDPAFSRRFDGWFYSQIYKTGPDTFSAL